MARNADLQALRDYVQGPTSQNQSETTVRLVVTHSNLNAKFMEIRLDLHVRNDVLLSHFADHNLNVKIFST